MYYFTQLWTDYGHNLIPPSPQLTHNYCLKLTQINEWSVALLQPVTMFKIYWAHYFALITLKRLP